MTVTRDEYLEINGVPLATFGWEATDISTVYGAPSIRGSDRLIPHKPGEDPLSRVQGVLRGPIALDVYGESDEDGTPYGDPRMGLIANMDYINANVIAPNPAGDGTVPVVWHLPDGSTRTANGIVESPSPPEPLDAYSMQIIFDLVIPSGVFVEGS